MKTPFPTRSLSLAIAMAFMVAGFPDTTHAAPIISEIMPSNTDTLADEDNEFHDWIELYNSGNAAYDLDGHFLTDDPEDLERWAFPEVSIPAKGFLIVFASGKDRAQADEELHANFRLNADGEYLALVGSDRETIISELAPAFPVMEAGQSYVAVESSGGSAYQITNNPTPNATNETNVVIFSLRSQAFTDSLTLELSSPSGEDIRYTTDGRKASLFNAQTYSAPIELTQTAMVAASVSGGPTHTEIFIKLDPELAERTSDIPIVVVDASATLNTNDFRDMAIALIEPAGNDGRTRLLGEFSLASRGGVRTRGETSESFPKKPLRFEFWDEDGADRDLAPFGWPAHSDFILNARYEFDRTLMHNAWIYYLSNQIGQWAVRTRFVELYLNTNTDDVSESDYNGIYTFMETISRGAGRLEVSRLSPEVTEEPEITGGYIFKKDKDDPGTWNFNGGGESLQMVYPPEEERDQRGHQADWLSNHLDELRTATASGGSDPETGYPKYIDTRAWIDHHLLNLLPLNVDALRLSGYFYKDREEKIIAGPIWDFDRSAGGTSDSRITDPFRWRGSGGDNGTHFFTTTLGTPIWWANLFNDLDFQQAWADRWNELRRFNMVTTEWDDTEMPAFSAENISRIIDHMAAEIMESQARNFARWPGAPPRNASQLMFSDKDGFEGEVEHIKGWLIARAEWIDDELITIPTITPAEQVHSGEVSLTMRAGGTLFKPDVIYYTTDGSDPRAPGGEIAPAAVLYESANPPVLTESALVVARKFDSTYKASTDGPEQQWSAPATIRYFVNEAPAGASNLVVAEIMYNPTDPSTTEAAAGYDDQDVFEFIEFLNIGSMTIDLSGSRLRGDSDFDFADGTKLAPGARLVLVSNREAFELRYPGAPVHGQYEGTLGNGGGRITLRDFEGTSFREFVYDDNAPWPTTPDGDGRSLLLKTPASNPDAGVATSWQTGTKTNGTPGTDEDGNGGSGSSEFVGWLAAEFTPEQQTDQTISGPQADADHDGLPTLAEYYTGGKPFEAEPAKVPTVSIVELEGAAYLAVSFIHLTTVEDVTAALELSSDLQTWVSGEADTVEVETRSNADGTETIIVRDATSLAELGGKERYARLRLTVQ